MSVYLIRHGHAGSRSSWASDDRSRPLDAKGRAQALHIAGLLADEPITRIVSSPAARCIETVEPLAKVLDLEVEASDALAEGADLDTALALVRDGIDTRAALCAHNDLIPRILRRLSATGMRADASHDAAKGSVWVLDEEDGSFVRARYHPPGTDAS